MDSSHDRFRPRGLPRWTLWAAIPVVLALGFVAGMAIATYRPQETPVAEQPPATKVQAPTAQTETPATPAPATTADPSWRIVTAGATPTAHPVSGVPDEIPVPAAPPVKFTGPATNSEEAKKALASDFGTFSEGGAIFQVEYQKMTHAGGSTSVVGMLKAADYPYWEKAVRERPAALNEWLENAAKRVQQASAREGFHVAWAVVDVVDARPSGFASYEVTPLQNGLYLVVRPLASTMDHTKTQISLRPLTSLQDSAANKQIAPSEPWATYGPVIRFTSDDLYRPRRAMDTKPKP